MLQLYMKPWRQRESIFYGWWLTGVAALVMVIGTVPIFQGMTAWFVVLEGHFGWNKTQLSLAFSLTRVEGSVMGPIGGYLVDKLGSRRMVLIGLLILGLGFLAFGRINSLWQFYAAFVLMSVGAGLGSWLPMMTVLNNWFRRRRSTAMAMAMEGFSIGGVLLIPLLVWAIEPDIPGRPGWQATAMAIGIAVILVAFPISRLVRNRPEDYGTHPDGVSPALQTTEVGTGANRATVVDVEGYTWQQAVRTKNFWVITLAHACSSTVIVTIMVHLGPMLVDRGFSLQMVGWVVSAYTGVGAVFTMVGGYVGDRVRLQKALFAFTSVQSVAVVALIQTHTFPMAMLFAVLLGIGFGGRTPLTTSMRGTYFGRKAFASITGISMIPMNVLFMAMPLFAGIMFDQRGSYFIPFTVVAILSTIGSVLFLMLGDPHSPVTSLQPERGTVAAD